MRLFLADRHVFRRLYARVRELIASGARRCGFDRWVRDFWPAAKAAGVSRGIYDAAFQGVTPDPEVLEKARTQPEFAHAALGLRVKARLREADQGRARHARPLPRAARQDRGRYGVDRHIVVAIWGMESYLWRGPLRSEDREGRDPLAGDARLWRPAARASLAGSSSSRRLNILQRGDISIAGMTGSWAGAMGHTQFIPTTYEAYAVDFDGDGRRDIWNSPADALASAANYLQQGRMGLRHDLGLRGGASAEVRLRGSPRDGKPRTIERMEEARRRARARRGLSAAGRQGRR